MSIYPPTGTLEIKDATLKIPVIDLQYTSNTAKIEANSNVVTEFSRSKKLIKYPRVAMTADNQPTGYVAIASSNHSQPTYGVYKAFNGVPNDFFHWETASFANSDGSYSAATQSFESTSGEWLKIQLPNKIKPTSTKLYRRGFDGQSPKDFKIYASITGSSWTLLTEQTGVDDWTNAAKSYSFTANIYYKYFAILVTKITRTNSAGAQTSGTIGEWELYGTPEYDPEAHGVDVTVKSLPNVPNTDWLEVYYDAKDLADGSTTVNDLKPVGTAVNGTVAGSTAVLDGAFTFDEADDYIEFPMGKTGNYIFSVSVWFKSSGSGVETLFHMNGDYAINSVVWLSIAGTNLSIDFVFNSYICDTGITIADGNWHHASFVYNGNGQSGRDIYFDGKRLIGVVGGQNAGQNLNLTSTSSTSRIGALNHTSGIIHEFKGSIANFRLFNRALSSDEIYQLYAYQKEYFGHGVLGMTLKAGRLGIGTSEPRAALDVRGDVNVDGRVLSGYASGGTESVVDGYKIHTFTTSSDFNVVTPGVVEYLIIGGGGGGGGTHGGAGGGGGFIQGHALVKSGSHSIVVGGGGTGSTAQGANGVSSTAFGLTAVGGGGGGRGYNSTDSSTGTIGGSSGGSGPYVLTGSDSQDFGKVPQKTYANRYQGNAGGGGNNVGGAGHGGGGGGAGGAGGAPISGYYSAQGISGAGGSGLVSYITGSLVSYAGGGSGGRWGGSQAINVTGGVGGTSGGGGIGGATGASAQNATAGGINTGGGGGGGGDAGGRGGNGGSGIVVLRYPL